jgi:hypothetical protein
MSDTEFDPDISLLPALQAVRGTWSGRVEQEDLREICCQQYNSARPGEAANLVTPRADRPCMWLHNVLSLEECRALVQAGVRYHQEEPPENYREPGLRSQFTAEDPEMSRLLWERIKEHIPACVDGGVAVGLKTRIAHSMYWEGQVGFPHMDFRHGHDGRHFGEPGDREACIASRISFTVYLNDEYEGGDLSFVARLNMDGTIEGEHSRRHPKAGSAVLFYQGVPEFAHLPHEVRGGCKSILRADVLFRFADKEAADVGCTRVN